MTPHDLGYQTQLAVNSSDEIVIPSSKKKIGLIAVGALLFAAVGGFLYSSRKHYIGVESHFVASIGIASIIFFGLCAVYALRKLIGTSPAVVINREGILDNSSGISAGLIRWTEIKGMWVTEVQGQRFLTIDVLAPDIYLDRGNALQRFLKRLNAKLYGSPIQIPASGVGVSFDELLRIAEDRFKKFGPR